MFENPIIIDLWTQEIIFFSPWNKTKYNKIVLWSAGWGINLNSVCLNNL